MKLFSVSLLIISSIFFTGWETDFESAKQKAHQEHKYILLNFSGSDWCGPCIRMKNEIFENAGFKIYADSNLVLINADFPRAKKNQLEKQQQEKNNKLAEKYNPDGLFPFTVLMNEDGKVLNNWEGFPGKGPVDFIKQVKEISNASK
jgi:thioredoxin-related protein